MRNPKQVTPVMEGINRRFFAAVGVLIDMKSVNSLSAFCIEFDLSAPRYREMRATYGVNPNPNAKPSRYKHIEMDALYLLCKEYRISAEWLLLGKGYMFKN